VSNGRDYDSNWVPWVEEERDVTVLESVKIRGFDISESEASPITLLRYRSEFFVESDGHRRVSAARRLRVDEIEADVCELQPRS